MMKRAVIILGILVMILLASLSIIFSHRFDAIASNPNSLIRHFSPTWRSFKKIVDIPYIMYGSLQPTHLPVYKIKLTKNDRFNLLNNLPNYPQQNKMTEDFRDTVKAEFSTDSYYTNDAKIRYRGVSPNHWNAIKKSWQVSVPPDALLHGREDFRFFIGEDKGWIKAFLWNHLGDKLHILTLEAEPVELIVNERPMGLYILMEGWEPGFLERNNRKPGSLYSNINSNISNVDLFRTEYVRQWSDRSNELIDPEDVPHLKQFVTVVANTPDSVFAQEIAPIVDLDQFYRWTLATLLSGNFNQGNSANLNFYFNADTRKFEPIFFDATLTPLSDPIDLSNHRLASRVLSAPELRTEFENIARLYLTDANLEDDLRFYDEMTEKIRPALYQDTVKLPTTYASLKKIELDRTLYEQNFKIMQAMLKNEGTLRYKFADETYPLSPR